MRNVGKSGPIYLRFLGVASLAIGLVLGPVAGPTYANDVSNALNYPGSVQPAGIAPAFTQTGTGADTHTDPALVVTTRRSNCTPETVERISETGARTTLATLPARSVCPHTDVAVNVDGDATAPFTAAGFFLYAYVSQADRIYRIPPSGIPTPLQTTAAFAVIPGCEIVSLLFDTVGQFGENLLAVCTSDGTAKVYKIGPGGGTIGSSGLVTAAIDDSISQAAIAPGNWTFDGELLRGYLLLYERDAFGTGTPNHLVAVSGTGAVTRLPGLAATNTELVRVHRIPGRFESFLGGAYIATDPAGTRLRKISSSTFTGDEGDVLLVTQTTGTRYIGASGQGSFVADNGHAIPSEDGAFSPIVFVQIVCDPASIPNNNNGPKGTVKCIFYSGNGVVDPVNDVIWQSVKCGAYGGPDEASVVLSPIPNGEPADLNGDGFDEQRFKFDSKDTFLSPGDRVVCTGETVADASHLFD